MPNSQRFGSLRRRLAGLRQHMLPEKFSPTGSYSARQIDRARGYRLLAHAEIEAFIEDISREAAVEKIREWSNYRKPSDLLICFLAFYHGGWEEEASAERAFPSSSRSLVRDAVKEAVEIALRQYIQILNSNHGIREKDLKRLVLPLGVRLDELDPTWVTNMDEFGKKRGELAHKTVGAQQAIDPLSELDSVNDLLKGLKDLDAIIFNLTR